MDEFGELTGRRYDVVMPYRLEDADYAIVGSGCMIETGRSRRRLHARALGIKVGLAAHHLLPAVPFGGYCAGAAARARPSP